MEKELTAGNSMQEIYLLETLPLLWQLAASRNRNIPDWSTVEDLRQTVLLNLLKWKSRRPEINLSAEEWARLANTAMINQIKSFHQKKNLRREINLSAFEEKSEKTFRENGASKLKTNSPVGNTGVEVGSLLVRLWSVIESFSLREKYALLFKNEEVLREIVGRRVLNIKQVSSVCRLAIGELFAVIEMLPLADTEIARLLEAKLETKITAKQVLEARH